VNKLNAISSVINMGSRVVSATPIGIIGNQLGGLVGYDPTPTIGRLGGLATSVNAGSLRQIRGGQNTGTTITVNAGIGDPVEIGRSVYNALQAFERRNGGR
jgi:hypothetical protein